MQNKDSILQILDNLAKDWYVAKGLIQIVQNSNDNNILDIVIDTIERESKKIKDKKLKTNVLKHMSVLERLRTRENKSREKDNKDAEDLLNQIEI